ncbi:TRAP transporter permease [Tenuibacillus multivorans]|uniref:TRAP transporter, 4TM/12TM fusion protein n=1 Tax=Tenuibacillus multivorans TaxID=237069 RepID=A0A1H0AVN9_9BACI|nr:TRAP transporter fused permease subunit [Tenuibacillus multivorans]GEL77807.1 C4-dicarboxylate ABC transporter [Tenuibacillus multivorans]SDN37266.1 TRAP transporter, 4TM/12TM fusion protein [Tenuibacillus multivorans]
MDEKQQQKMINELEGSDRELSGLWAVAVIIVAVFMSAFHFYVAGFGLPGIGSKTFLIFHLTLALVLIFMIFPIKKRMGQTNIPIYDIALAAYAFYVGMFIIQRQDASSIMSGDPTGYEIFIGLSLIILVLEATRRVVGYPLVVIAFIFIAYFFLGEFMPGQFHHTRGDFERFIYEITYRNNGIFGTPIYASAQFVFIFILFGAVLESTGAGKMFIDLALRAFGRFKGGPAKASVMASGMMGSISGSSTANAVTTGTFTIPLMKKVGFKPHVAGGVEVAASSSGQFLPPIMGAAAFIMVELTSIPYYEIIQSAIIPAILCYVGILFMVHFEASKNGIKGMDRSELVKGRRLLMQQGYLLIPIFVLLYFLVIERVSVNNSAFFSITILLVIALFAHRFKESVGRAFVFAAILLGLAYSIQFIIQYVNIGLYNLNDVFNISFFSSETIRWKGEIATMVLIGIIVALVFALGQKKFKVDAAPVRYGARELLSGFELAARNSLSIVVACATAGILIGVITTSGLSTKFTRIVVGFSSDLAALVPSFMTTENTELYFALILTVFACLLLGLGLPTTATYVVLAAIVAPVLVDMDVPVIVAHLFVLYYGVLADDTPPINLPAYATAGIANAGPVRTGVQGFKFDTAALLLPFVFTMNPTILLITDAGWIEVTLAIITATIGMVAFASFIQNWLITKYHWIERMIALVVALMFIQNNVWTDIGAVVIAAGLFGFQYYKSKKQNKEVTAKAS